MMPLFRNPCGESDWSLLARENLKPSNNQSERLHGSMKNYVIKMEFGGLNLASRTERIKNRACLSRDEETVSETSNSVLPYHHYKKTRLLN